MAGSTAAQVQPGYLDDNGNWHPYGPYSFVVGASGQVNGAIAVTDVSSTPLHMTGTGTSYVISNGGSKTAFIAFGDASVTVTGPTNGAIAGGYAILAGAIMTVSGPSIAASYIAAICLSAETTTLYISQGSGS